MTTVADLLEAAAARHPDAVAAVSGLDSLTYIELDARATRLAAHLQSKGVGPDVTVGVCLNRSIDLAVAVVGVLKAGGACVPLDPAYPAERLAFMVDDAAVRAVITRPDLAARLPAGIPVVPPDIASASTFAARTVGAGDVAYVIYTSGSTGRPKGVLLTNRGLVNHHRAVIDLYGLASGDRVLQFCSLGFDASIEEMLPTWAAGAAVVFRPEDRPLLGPDWSDWLAGEGITVANLPTAYWHAWARDLDAGGRQVPESIRLVVVGGEKASGRARRTWAGLSGGRSRWVNAYGPTETTCMSTYYEAPAGGGPGDADPPIGRPLPGTTVAVVDEGLRPAAAGVTGELLIGGLGLARGYLGDPELTAARFVDWGGERMYRTGDLVRERPEGDLDYVGRIDEQVKIQGFRIECGEVEAALVQHPAVAEAVVVARDDPPGDRRLVAYVIGAGVLASALRAFLAARLPIHMVPSAYVAIDALPLTANGKIDRSALPAPASPLAGAPARSPDEDRMAAIWAAVLGLDVSGIGAGDDFFALGGHSLLATQVIAKVREEFGTQTPLRAVFQAPTLGGLTAVAVAEGAGVTPAPVLVARRREPGERLPLSLAQEQMWELEATATPPGLYNFTALHQFDGPVDVDALRDALAYVVDRHEILRAGITDGPAQFVVPSVTVDVAIAEGSVAEQNAAPFDLARPPLLRAGLYPLDDGTTQLAVTFDHLVCDGTGAEIFLSEVLVAYRGAAATLPALPVQFPDFAVWQRASVTEEVLRRQLDWWTETLRDMPLGPAVPFDHLPDAPTRRFGSRPVDVGPATRARLEAVARATGSTVFTVAVAAVSALFGRHGGLSDVVFSTTLSGRTRAELEDLVGMFSGIGRLRTDLSGDPSFAAVVTRTRERVLGMFENQDIPFLRVRRALFPDFPSGPAVVAALPTELQYFHTTGDHEVFFRGQLVPLSLTLLDDGERITGSWSWKLDFYDTATVDRLAGDLSAVLDAVGRDPSMRVSQLPVSQ